MFQFTTKTHLLIILIEILMKKKDQVIRAHIIFFYVSYCKRTLISTVNSQISPFVMRTAQKIFLIAKSEEKMIKYSRNRLFIVLNRKVKNNKP